MLPLVVVDNQYGSNLDLLNLDEHVSLDQLEEFFKDSGLSYAQIFGGVDIPSVVEVETWKIYEFGKSLYNPTNINRTRYANVLDKQVVVLGGVYLG